MSIINSQPRIGAAGQSTGFKIERSLRFNSADDAHLDRTPASAGNRKTWTWSGWVKRSSFGFQALETVDDGPGEDSIAFLAGNTIRVYMSPVSGNGTVTDAVFRDSGAWYHIVVAVDTTQATAANRTIIYVNNVNVTSSSSNYITQNSDTKFNGTFVHYIGRYANQVQPSGNFDGYMTEINFIDGQALTPSSFGETDSATGVWKPKAYTGTYGTNGFYLNFSDNSNNTSTTLGKDYSGNGNNWTPNNFSVTAGVGNDSLVDSPTAYGTDTGAGGEVRGNYCTLNPLNNPASSTLTNGNLDVTTASSTGGRVVGTIGVSSGKWYWEITPTSVAGISLIGIAAASRVSSDGLGDFSDDYAYQDNGNKYSNSVGAAYGASYVANDVIGVALDLDAGTLVFYKNNSSQGTAYSSISGTFVPAMSDGQNANSSAFVCNFGQRPFAYTAPSGFKALCTQNLPTPTIGATATTRADDYFNTVLYTGTGSSLGVTGVGFQPDFVWIKERAGAADHALYDAVRGVQQQLESNTTTDETTESTGLTAFGSDGFTVGSLAQVNTSTDTYVAWNWKESTVSKFDIVTYTGNGTARTISHNLGVVPNMIIVKARTTASTDQGWPVYHSANTANPETDYLLLNSTAATADLDTVWNDTAPTSSVFSVGTNALVNANNDTYVAYLFANVAGYSAFGSYTGNGSSDGTFVYTGFRPEFVMVKNTSATSYWQINDAARNPYNLANLALHPNVSDAEATYSNAVMDILSNGFKLRGNDTYTNTNTNVYIYMAFAEVPTKFSLAR